MDSPTAKRLAQECGFELAGIALAAPLPEFGFYQQWVERGWAGEMKYLTDHRAGLRADPRHLLPSARSVICVGKHYNGPQPYSTEFRELKRAWISRYAWGEDYHVVVRRGLERLARRMREETGQAFEWRVAVDTAPLLERALARRAGLGWIGRNSCAINERVGSWFFLGELLVSLELEPDTPPPDRCGSCTRCVEACPTRAIVPTGVDQPAWTVDSRACISYLTIELRGPIPGEYHTRMGNNIFGCDICQDVCPWNRRAPRACDGAFGPRQFAPPLERLAAVTEVEFRRMFRGTPVTRARYRGFRRNVAIAIGNR